MKTDVSTPEGKCSNAANGPKAAAKRDRVYRLTNVTTSTSDPIRRNACRAPGSIDHPTSCPCVDATTREAPAARSRDAINANGAAAPNHTASQRAPRRMSDARRRTSGVGSINVPGCRTTSNGCTASNAGCEPEGDSHDGAYTTNSGSRTANACR